MIQDCVNLPLKLNLISQNISEKLKINGKSASMSPRNLRVILKEKQVGKNQPKNLNRISIQLIKRTARIYPKNKFKN